MLTDHPWFRFITLIWITTKRDCLYYAHLYRLRTVNSFAYPLCCSVTLMATDHPWRKNISTPVPVRLGNIWLSSLNLLLYLIYYFSLPVCIIFICNLLLYISYGLLPYLKNCVHLASCFGNKKSLVSKHFIW